MVWENSVRISGALHKVRDDEGRTRFGTYRAFTVRQDSEDENSVVRKDFLLVRAYDPAIKDLIAGAEEGDPIAVDGEMRSSSGSGQMYILARAVEKR
jgi:hypothetical protein